MKTNQETTCLLHYHIWNRDLLFNFEYYYENIIRYENNKFIIDYS